MDETIWGLPGPNRLIGQVAQEVVRGRHVAIVVPAVRAQEEAFVDGLLGALMQALTLVGQEPRVADGLTAGSNPLRALAECLVFGDEIPVVVSDLLDHTDAAGRTALLDCTVLPPDRNAEVATVLGRIAAESRPRAADRRPRIVAIGTRHILPSLGIGSIDLTFEAIWWWGRLTRWDVASRLAADLRTTDGREVLQELRLETIMEACRWDLDLAEHLARTWSGEPIDLAAAIAEATRDRAGNDEPCVIVGGSDSHPPDDAMARLWDIGRVEQWHHEACPSPDELLRLPGAIERAIWIAQARVLLPWIEVRRQRLLDALVARFGPGAVADAVRAATDNANGVLEFGSMYVVTRQLASRADGDLREAARQLKNTRNKLAHLQSLTVVEQMALVDACCTLQIATPLSRPTVAPTLAPARSDLG